MFKIIYIVSICIASSTPVWASYLLGFGGHERLVITGFLFVFIVLIITVGVFATSFFRLIVSLTRHHSYKGVGWVLLSFATICLFVGLPQFVSIKSKKLGALHRLQRMEEDSAYAQLMDLSRTLLSQSDTEGSSIKENFGIFKCLGVTEIIRHQESPAFIDAVTSGRPFHTGWLIYPNIDAPLGTKRVEVRPGLYRY